MRRIMFAAVLQWAWVAPVHAQAQLTPGAPVQLPAGWVWLGEYSDEFDAAVLDGDKWQDALPPWGAWTWDKPLVALSDGQLLLGMRYQQHEREGQLLHYKAGIVRSRAPPLRYGYFEARIKAAPRWPGVATAFWLFRNTLDYWTEIDIVEMMQRRLSKNVIDYSAYVMRGDFAAQLPVREKFHAVVEWDPSSAFHTYGCLWTADRIAFYVDGALLSEIRNAYWHEPMDIVLSLGLRAPLNRSPESSGFPAWAQVDYVRVWSTPVDNR